MKGTFMKIILLNEIVKCPFFKQKFKIGTCNDLI